VSNNLRLVNLELPVERAEEGLRAAIARRLAIPEPDVGPWRILRKSLDARQREQLKFVFSVVATAPDSSHWQSRYEHQLPPGVERYDVPLFEQPPAGDQPLEERPVIIGAGPAGLMAAYFLAQRGYQPLILERGDPVKVRVPDIRRFDRGGALDPEDNYLFGEGGAGTFSDGKLTCRLTGADVDWVLDQFVACGAKPEIRYEYRPHLGSNRLPMLVRNLRRKIEAWGGTYQFRCRVEGLDLVDGRLRGLQTSSGYIKCSVVILAIGHSARDTYSMLHASGVPLVAKPFQLGVRIEQPQEQIDGHKYGRPEYRALLGAADYTLVAHGLRDVFTFCMCAGGVVIPSVSEPGMFCTNGMSNSRHDSGFANSGVMVTIDPSEFGSDHPLAGVELQRKYERLAFDLGRGEYRVPIQRASDFVSGVSSGATFTGPCSYPRDQVSANVNDVLPPTVAAALRDGLPRMDRSFRGNFLRGAMVVGPEMRGSAPLRLLRDQRSRQSPTIAGLFPVGEGAGYAGGIISAAVDGLRSAKALAAYYRPVS
jgi:uncharacterized FAD-dependent dehydrogenase